MQLRKMLFTALAVGAVALGNAGTTAQATDQSHGYNNGDSGFVNLAVTEPIVASGRASTDVLSMVGHCTFDQTVVPFSNDAVVQVVGKGAVTARDSSKVLGVAVRCTLKDFATGAVLYDHWDGLPGSAGAWAAAPQQKVARLVVCTQVKALLSSGDVTSQAYPCQEPSVLPA
jgi:hypothetical protein